MLRFRPHRLFLSLVGLLSVLTGSAVTYYVSPAGSDSNPGTSMAVAWQSISRVNSADLQPGDSVLFEGGQHHPGNLYFGNTDANNSALPVVISSFGTGAAIIDAGLGKAISVYNTQGLKFSNLILNGAGMNVNSADGVTLLTDLNVKPSNIAFDNIEISGFGKTGLTVGAWIGNTGFDNVLINRVRVHDVRTNGITSYGYTSPSHVGWAHTNIVVSNCEVYNVPGFADPNNHKGSGIMLAQIDHGLIERCVAHHNGTANIACGGPGGIWVYDSNDITIQHCESYRNSAGSGCDGLGFDLDGGVTNSVIQYCYSHDNDGAGFLLGQYANARIWKNNAVRFNISVNDGRTNSGGITLFKGSGTVMHSVDIYHNTVYFSKPASNSGAGAFTMIDWNTGIDSVRVFNNLFYTSGNVPLVLLPAGYSAMMAGNLYWSGTGNFLVYDSNSGYASLNAWRAATGKETQGNAATGLETDPLLAGAGQSPIAWPSAPASVANYKPAAGSPAVNAALALAPYNIATGSVDFYSSVFPSGPKADIGAAEFYFAPVTPSVPPTPTVAVTSGTSTVPGISTGIADAGHDADFVLYPNPLTRGGILNVKGVTSIDEMTIFTLTGELVASFAGNTFSDTYRLASGMYLVIVNGSVTKRLLVR
jgi:hypothetical protein